MSLGVGIFLLAVGAILAYAVDFTVQGIDIQAAGVILMVAGAIGIVIGTILLLRRRSISSASRTAIDPVDGGRVTRSETTDSL